MSVSATMMLLNELLTCTMPDSEPCAVLIWERTRLNPVDIPLSKVLPLLLLG